MVKNHLKRIAAPKTWKIDRKENTFITQPKPGAHNKDYSMPLSLALRELLKVAKSAKEAKQIIKIKDVFVDKRKRVDERFPVGVMDIIEFPQLEEQFRLLLDAKGRLTAVKSGPKESGIKLSRIESKTKLAGGKTQLNMNDGRNIIIVDKDPYKTGDTLQLALPEQKIMDHFKLEKGASVMLIGGKHSGMLAKIDEISGKKVIIKTAKNQKHETLRRHTFVIGKDKPALDCFKELSKQ